MDDQKRRARTLEVYNKIDATVGREAAELWCSELTPMPIGLPTDEQLRDGERIAAGADLSLMLRLADEELNVAMRIAKWRHEADERMEAAK